MAATSWGNASRVSQFAHLKNEKKKRKKKKNTEKKKKKKENKRERNNLGTQPHAYHNLSQPWISYDQLWHLTYDNLS